MCIRDRLLVYISDNFDFIKDYCEKYIPQIHPNVPDATYLVWLDCRELGMSNDCLLYTSYFKEEPEEGRFVI